MDDTAFFMDLKHMNKYSCRNSRRRNEYILENMEVKIQFFGSEVIGVQLQQLSCCVAEHNQKVQQLLVQVNQFN